MYTLGIDLSTQSISATLLQKSISGEVLCCGSWSVAFRDCLESSNYLIDRQTLCISSLSQKHPGFFAQDPQLFLCTLDRLLATLQADGAPLHLVEAINGSAQQHGQLWLNETFASCCQKLESPSADSLASLFATSYAYPAAPIWMCSQTAAEARYVNRSLGSDKVLKLSGSAAPLRFSGLVLRWLAQREQGSYNRCVQIHLLSSWLAAVLSGESAVSLDWGSGAGTLLMDYHKRNWSDPLLECVAAGLPGGGEGLRTRLPRLGSPLSRVGHVATYFCKYGFRKDCLVFAGSGDNPQTKVCQQGDLLSLGSSFVWMSGSAMIHPWVNAMYDGLGQPFSFACRTNGALVWDAIRSKLGLSLEEQERALQQYPLQQTMHTKLQTASALQEFPSVNEQDFANILPAPRLLQESFPPTPQNLLRMGDFQKSRASECKTSAEILVAAIDATLLEFHQAVYQVFGQNGEILYVTGGLVQSAQILQRIEAIWQRSVKTLSSVGASYGAALAGFAALYV